METSIQRRLTRGLLTAALLAALAASTAWFVSVREQGSEEAAANLAHPAAPGHAASSPSRTDGFWSRLAKAGQAADRSSLSDEAEVAWLLDPAHDAQWCSRGQAQLISAHGAEKERLGKVGFMAPFMLRVRGNPAALALAKRGQARLDEWVRQLSERGDPLSLALGDWLTIRLMSELHVDRMDDPPAQLRLLASGRDNSDERIRWLAASALCSATRPGEPACQDLLQYWEQQRPQDWTLLNKRIERGIEKTPQAQIDALLARFADSSSLPPDLSTVRAALLSLLPSGEQKAGLNQAVDAQLMTVALEGLSGVMTNPLHHCIGSHASASNSCDRLIRRLTDQMEVPAAENDLSVLIGSQFSLTDRPSRWRNLSDEWFAVYQWRKQAGLGWRLSQDEVPGHCEKLDERSEHLRRRLALGDWPAAQEQMRKALAGPAKGAPG